MGGLCGRVDLCGRTGAECADRDVRFKGTVHACCRKVPLEESRRGRAQEEIS